MKQITFEAKVTGLHIAFEPFRATMDYELTGGGEVIQKSVDIEISKWLQERLEGFLNVKLKELE